MNSDNFVKTMCCLMPLDFADYHRIALLTGCETIDDVILWADKEIARCDTPEPALIDSSLGKSSPISKINELLMTLVVDLNDSSALMTVLIQIADMVREDRIPVDVVIERIYNYAQSNCPKGDLRLAFISLAEDLSCIRDGVFWTDDVTTLREPLLETIACYCQRSDDQDDIANA